MAYETFNEDTIVDIKPYVPQNWHPDYRFNRFVTNIFIKKYFLINHFNIFLYLNILYIKYFLNNY